MCLLCRQMSWEVMHEPVYTEGGAVGSQDFSPDSVGWETSGKRVASAPGTSVVAHMGIGFVGPEM